MRIQHNIPAMLAYRNYSTNVSALSKNLEKLSSGYKINRAGDDAAGLAISEKMRAQITGLETAQKNAKDGISLIQTAEGALTEVHDMLNRMYELAEQSANGTYADEVDREQLQKEIESLRTEINRIADSSNFNGIKLLDGSLDSNSTAKADAVAAAETAKAAVETAHGEMVLGKETTGAELAKDTAKILEQSTNNDISEVGTKTIVETDFKDSGKPGFTVNFDGVSHAFKKVDETDATDDGVKSFTLQIGTIKTTISESEIAAAYQEVKGEAAKNGDVADAEVLAKAFDTKLAGAFTGATPSGASAANAYTVTLKDGTLIFEATNNLDKAPLRHFDVKINGVKQEDNDATKHKYTSTSYGVGGNNGATDLTAAVEATIDGQTVTFNMAGTAPNTAVGDIPAKLEEATATIGGKTVKLGDYFTITEASNQISFEAKDAGANGPKVDSFTVTDASTTGTKVTLAAGDPTIVKGADAYKSGTTGYVNYGTEVTIQAGKANVDQLASTTLTLAAADVKDGTVIRLGDQKYVIAVGDDSAYKDVENAVYVEGLKADDAKFLDKICTKLAEVAKNNETFTVSHEGTGGKIGLKQLAAVKDTTDMSTMDKLCGYIGLSSVDADKTAANNAAAKAEAQAAADAAQKKADATKEGKALSLQIGDTSEDFNKMDVNVKDCHAAAMGIGEIDISTQDGASKAMNNIKDAINYVSDVRGDLGALQNRLDHTISNLSVMQENIQDAESTIRDVDVAKEMMEYTKNSILVQSAQAMLAQANQLPQGVLQLLG